MRGMTWESGQPILRGLWLPVSRSIGWPRTQGSHTPQIVRGKGGRQRVRLVDTDEAYQWRAQIADGVKRALGAGWVPIPRPVQVKGVLTVMVPFDDVTIKQAGDWDKHSRLVCDALTIAKLWEDDSQANGWGPVFKLTADDRAGPGIVLSLWIL